MENFKSIEELAAKVKENSTWVRDALEKLMTKISEIETDEEIFAKVIEGDIKGYIVLGKGDIVNANNGDYFPNSYSWIKLEISEIKKILREFPTTIENLKEKMKKKNIATEELKKEFSFLK